MIAVSDLCIPVLPPSPPEGEAAPICLSIVYRCQPQDLARLLATLDTFARLGLPQDCIIEHIVVYHSEAGQSLPEVPHQLQSASTLQLIQLIWGGPDRSLPGLSYTLGIAACRGPWVWLWEPGSEFTASDILAIVETLTSLAPTSQPDCSHQHKPHNTIVLLQPPADPARNASVTIDHIYNGLCPAVDGIVWPTALFQRWGCFDPHIAVGEWFVYEMLLRTIRHVRVTTLQTRTGLPAVMAPDRLLDVVLYADSHPAPPSFSTLLDYALDDLSAVERKHGSRVAWRLYLEKVLPYYYANRHWLPPGLLITPQSVPRDSVSAVFTKVQYETSSELTFWNYERHFKGQRRFLFSYLQSAMLHAPTRDQSLAPELSLGQLDAVDVLVATRTADSWNTQLLQTTQTSPTATAYLLDDNLLTFWEYGEDFAGFCPGSPHYEAMVQAIQAADTIIGFSPPIAEATAKLNPRYVACQPSIPDALLPPRADKTPQPAPFHFGYAGGGYRSAEFALLRPAIERIIAEYGDTVQFSFWGLEPSNSPLSGLTGNISFAPFSPHYGEYLERLQTAGFDAMLVPLLHQPTPKQAKNANKFLEAVVANAVGLYSDVPSYAVVGHEQTGLKVAGTTEAWYTAMKAVLNMPETQRTRLRQTALDHVRTFYAVSSLAWTHECGLLMAEFHRKTRAKRSDDGRPLGAFFFPCIAGTGGGEIQLWRRFALAQQLGLRPLVVIAQAWEDSADAARVRSYLTDLGIEFEFVVYDALFTTPETDAILPTPVQLSALRDFFGRYADRLALVHSLAFLPAVGMVCAEFGIPHLASIYGIDDTYELPNGGLPFPYCDLIQSDSIRYAKKWSQLLTCDWICARETVPAEIFEIGFRRLYASTSTDSSASAPVRLSVVGSFMPRKSQLEVLRALGILEAQLRARIELHFFGLIEVYPDYAAACRQAREAARRLGIRVVFHGHVEDLEQIYRHTDILLSVSSFESFPNSIKEATAAGSLVITSTAGGITELMRDGINCLVVEDPQPQAIAQAIATALTACPATLLRIRRNAYRLACEEFHARRTMHDLALCYNLCLDVAQKHQRPSQQRAASLAAQDSSSLPADIPRDRTAVTTRPAGSSSNPFPSSSSPCLPYPTTGPSHAARSHILLDPVVHYTLLPLHPDWAELAILLGTHQRPATGFLQLDILSLRKQLLRQATISLASIPDNSWVTFRFEPIQHANTQPCRVVLQVRNPGPQTRVSVYETRPFDKRYQRVLQRLGQRLGIHPPRVGLYCQLGYSHSSATEERQP